MIFNLHESVIYRYLLFQHNQTQRRWISVRNKEQLNPCYFTKKKKKNLIHFLQKKKKLNPCRTMFAEIMR